MDDCITPVTMYIYFSVNPFSGQNNINFCTIMLIIYHCQVRLGEARPTKRNSFKIQIASVHFQ